MSDDGISKDDEIKLNVAIATLGEKVENQSKLIADGIKANTDLNKTMSELFTEIRVKNVQDKALSKKVDAIEGWKESSAPVIIRSKSIQDNIDNFWKGISSNLGKTFLGVIGVALLLYIFPAFRALLGIAM